LEEASAKRGWVHRNSKVITVVILLTIMPQIIVYTINIITQINLENNPELDPYYEAEYNLTVWIAPEEKEFILNLDIYGSEQDAYSKVNKYHSIGIRVEPFDNEKNDLHLFNVPKDRLSVWVKVYFNEDTEEPNIIVQIGMGSKITTHLLGREISILIVPLA
jgi:hypothetical protein